MKFTRRTFCMTAALGFSTQASWAQEWPAKQPIRIIVPYPAGGNADSAARAVAEAASANLKQTIIIDNRPGASSIIGTDAVARAPADGYTLGVVSDSHAINQALSGRGDEIGASLVEIGQVFDGINQELPALESGLEDLATFSQTYSEALPDLINALDALRFEGPGNAALTVVDGAGICWEFAPPSTSTEAASFCAASSRLQSLTTRFESCSCEDRRIVVSIAVLKWRGGIDDRADSAACSSLLRRSL